MAEPFIGEVALYGFDFAPNNWLRCEGQIMQISANQALFSLVGNFYGGDGRSTFALPDLRGKVTMSFGQHPGSLFNYKTGQTSGTETHTMTIAELAQHSHFAFFEADGTTSAELMVSTDAADQNTPTDGSYLCRTALSFCRPDEGDDTVFLGGVSGGGTINGTTELGSTGSSRSFNLIQASLVQNYCIALQGLFPSRN